VTRATTLAEERLIGLVADERVDELVVQK